MSEVDKKCKALSRVCKELNLPWLDDAIESLIRAAVDEVVSKRMDSHERQFHDMD